MYFLEPGAVTAPGSKKSFRTHFLAAYLNWAHDSAKRVAAVG